MKNLTNLKADIETVDDSPLQKSAFIRSPKLSVAWNAGGVFIFNSSGCVKIPLEELHKLATTAEPLLTNHNS